MCDTVVFKNYFLSALRNLHRHGGYSLINISGLALGMAACMLIFQFVAFEYSFDDYHVKRDELHRLHITVERNGEEPSTGATFGYGFGPAITEEVPEVVRQARVHPEYAGAVISVPSRPGASFKDNEILYVDPSFLEMFSLPLISGDPATALAEPGTMLLSQSTARRLFGTEDVVGQTLEYTGWIEESFRITGIFEDIPANTHLRFEMLLPLQDLLTGSDYSDPSSAWNWSNFIQYVELRDGADPARVAEKLTAVMARYQGESHRERGLSVTVRTQPVSDIHLNPEIFAPATITGSQRTVYFFTIIGIITLMIALVNYINLATARALERAREVGVRKVVGAQRDQLIVQFLFESGLTNLVAALLAIALASSITPLINTVAGTHFSNALWLNPVFWGAFLVTLLVTILLAGLYPAFVLSSFKPVSVLKGKAGSFTTGLYLRRSLVVLQFAASVILVVGTVIVYAQLDYMRNMNDTIELEQVMTVTGPRVLDENTSRQDAIGTFVESLRQIPGIREIATSATLPGGGFQFYTSGVRLDTADPTSDIDGTFTWIDTTFASLYDINLIAGGIPEGYSGTPPEGEPFPAIASYQAVKALGFEAPAEALEKIVNIGGARGRVVGVFEEFNWSSAHEEREAAFFGLSNYGTQVSLKVNTENLDQTIAAVENIYLTLFPGNPFEYGFADEQFDRQYQEDRRFATLFTLFAGLAIGIACLGLFGLASFTAQRRSKEIGVRKVLGATVTGIAARLSMDFLKLVLVAILIAVPISYFIMNRWLDSFAYRIEIGPGVFLIAGAVAIFIALATVAYQSIRAAMANPVKSLRYE